MSRESELTTDDELVRRVGDALEADERTADATIQAIAQSGQVTLEGAVRSRDVRRAANEIAAAQPGVITVTNDLRVVPDESAGDVLDANPWGFVGSGPVVAPEREIEEK